MNKETIAALLQRPVAYHPIFRRVTGSTAAAVMLSQMYYWTSEGRISASRDGWFHKTQAAWEVETGLSRSEQDRARRDLCKAGLLEEVRKGSPAKMWFRMNRSHLFALVAQYAESCNLNKNNSLQDSAIKTAESRTLNENNNLDVAPNFADGADKPNENSSLQNPAIKTAESCNPECEILQTGLQNPAIQNAESCNLKEQRVLHRLPETTTTPAAGESPDSPVTDTPDHAHLFAVEPPISSQGQSRRFAMHWEWQTGPTFAGRCAMMGVSLSKIPAEQADELLNEFRSYWVDQAAQNSQGQWEHKLAQRLLRIASVRPLTSPPVEITTPKHRRQAVTAAVMDIRDTDW